MNIFSKFTKRSNQKIGIVLDASDKGICVPGYTSLDQNPEIMTGVRKIAELIASMTIHLMNNTENGDIRIENELSKMIDITPTPLLTRQKWMTFIVETLLLQGNGNAIVKPYTRGGYLRRLEPISADRVSFMPIGYNDYRVMIDGRQYKPSQVLHFVQNPDRWYAWKGNGITVPLRMIADNLKQVQATTHGFLSSKFMPSMIVGVDAMVDDFSDPKKRQKILDDYVANTEKGQPWIVPMEQFKVETVKPLSLKDLAISDNVEIDKRTIAAVLGVPPFLLGVGEYNKDAWNNFIQQTIAPIAIGIQQELTRKLIINPNWYLRFNTMSLMDWDIKTLADVFCTLGDRGYVDGNEVRDKLGMSPREGLDELRILENYIPYDMSALQKKLVQEGE